MYSKNLLLVLTVASSTVTAYGSHGGSGYYGGSGGRGSGSNDDDDNGSNSAQVLGFNVQTMQAIRIAHGVLASAAFVFFFPVGAIAIRLIPSRLAIWIHAAFQVFAFLIYTAAFGLGIWMVDKMRFGGSSFVSFVDDKSTSSLADFVCS